MTPAQLAKAGTEHAIQTAFFCWLAMAARRGFAAANDEHCYIGGGFQYAEEAYGTKDALPELEWVYAIPNGGSRGDTARTAQIVGGKLKAEGVKAGVSDICVPIRRGAWPGLYIEMKKPGGKVSTEQKAFGAFVKSQGYGFVVCYSWTEARDVLTQYLTQT